MRGVFDATRELGGGESRPAGPSATARTNRDRGQSHVVAFVLLVGIVTTGSVAVVVLGTAAIDEYETSVEIESAEQQLVDFAHAADTVTTTTDDARPVSIGAFDQGAVETHTDAGQVRIVQTTESGTAELYSEPLGAITYTSGDTEIAYQAGGVWRSDGSGSVPVSSPGLEYQDETLSFSIARLDQTGTRGDTVDGSVHQIGSPIGVDLRDGRHVSGGAAAGDVRFEIESEYCDGWERTIEERLPGAITERCSDGTDQRVQFELTVPQTIDTVDSAIVAPEIDVHENAPPIEGDVRTDSVDEDRVDGSVLRAGYDYPSIDRQATAAVEDCEADGFSELPETVTEPGQYCVKTIDDDHTFDTSDGDIEVVVRDSIGEPHYQDELRVEGDNELTIVVDGDLDARGDAVIGNESDPSQTRLLFSEASSVTTANGGPTIAALLYAPDSSVSVQGNPTINGSIVAEHVELGNVQPGGVVYGGPISDIEASIGVTHPLAYFDVTAAELSIDD